MGMGFKLVASEVCRVGARGGVDLPPKEKPSQSWLRLTIKLSENQAMEHDGIMNFGFVGY